MILYHTSISTIDKPDVVHSRPHLDFGKGFYLTGIRMQAVSYGDRFIKQGEVAILNQYELQPIDSNFSHKIFNAYDAEWLDFIAACRKGLPHQHFDIIEGGVADDQVFNTIDLYFAGIYTKEQALQELRFKKPNHQICITNQAVIDQYLRFIKSVKL